MRRLKAARDWLEGRDRQLRDARLAPFAAHSQRIWEELRQESNVELGRMTPVRHRDATGGSPSRPRVDGTDNGTALA